MNKKALKKVLIILLCFIFIMSLVNRVVHVIKKEKKKTYDEAVSYVLEKVKNWHEDNYAKFKNSIIVNLTLKDLIDDGYIKIGESPLADQSFELDTKFCVINDNGEYSYRLDDSKNCGQTVINITKTPENDYNGYLYSEIFDIDFYALEGLEYYIKSTTSTESNINVNYTCGKEEVPVSCTEIKSTKNLKANTWYKVSGSLILTYEQHSDIEGSLYTLVTDERGYEKIVAVPISKIDRVNPVVVLESPVSTTNSISVKISSIIDNETGIASSICRYGEDGIYETVSMSNTKGKLSKCIINYKLKDKVYYYQICATDEVGNVGCASGSSLIQSVKNPIIKYKESNILSVDFNNKNKSLEYYIKSTKAATLDIKTLGYCGKGELPDDCINNNVLELLPNVWYKVSDNIEYTGESGTLYAVIKTTNDTFVSTTANVGK